VRFSFAGAEVNFFTQNYEHYLLPGYYITRPEYRTQLK